MFNHELIMFKNSSRANQLDCVISYFFQLHLIFHACVERFDVTGTVGKILGTKRDLCIFGKGSGQTCTHRVIFCFEE